MNHWDTEIESIKKDIMEKGWFSGDLTKWEVITAMALAIHEINETLAESGTPSCEQEGAVLNEQPQSQTEILLQTILLRLEELTLMYLNQTGLVHSSGSELHRELLDSIRNNRNRKDS